jgi:chaperonin GroEL
MDGGQIHLSGNPFGTTLDGPLEDTRITQEVVDAASIAGLMITTEAGVAEAPKRETGGHAESHGGMGGMM